MLSRKFHRAAGDRLVKLPEKITRYTPDFILEQVIASALNHLLGKELSAGELDFLERKLATVNIRDLNFSFTVTAYDKRIKVMIPAQISEVTLRTDQQSLLEMLHNEVDPDTLFFQRRLLITGNTELGLYLKNFIDSLELMGRIPAPVMKLISLIHKQSQKSL